MAPGYQISFDASDPRALGAFWAQALQGYVEQPPPPGHDSWEAFGEAVGLPADTIDRMYALVDPQGVLPRLLFQKVPEGKESKNRMHLDINVGSHDDLGPAREHAARLVAAGATLVEERRDQMSAWIVLLDPEGNEFCVQ